MPDTNSDEERVKAMYRIGNADRVTELVKAPLQEVIHFEGERAFLRASDDLLMLLVFTYINLLGYYYKGSWTTASAVEFIREYLGRVDQRYKEVGGLLYHALRHGMVHLATPKRIKLKDGRMLDFYFQRSGQREDCLKITRYPEKSATGTKIYIDRLSLDIPLLYRDLLSAIDEYTKDIKINHELSDVFTEAFIARRKPEEEQELRKKYNRDLDFIYKLLG
jgi:hypothetical protein